MTSSGTGLWQIPTGLGQKFTWAQKKNGIDSDNAEEQKKMGRLM